VEVELAAEYQAEATPEITTIAYNVGESSSGCSSDGFGLITTLAECQTAIDTYDSGSWASADNDNTAGNDDYATWPKGCYRNAGNGYVYFNDHVDAVNGGTDSGSYCTSTYQCLCMKTTVTPATYITIPAAMGEKSFEVCDSFAAMAEAARAAVMADRTCTPSMNCLDNPNGHACLVSRIEDPLSETDPKEEKNYYYCEIKTYDAVVAVENPAEAPFFPNGKFTGLSATQVSSCGDVYDVDLSGTDHFFSADICEAYGALAEAGLSCVQETDCIPVGGEKCIEHPADGYYYCKVAEGATACTDVFQSGDDFYSKEVCDAFAAAEAARKAEIQALKTCSPSSNCVDDPNLDDGSTHACQI
jgi:hypothetical protein